MYTRAMWAFLYFILNVFFCYLTRKKREHADCGPCARCSRRGWSFLQVPATISCSPTLTPGVCCSRHEFLENTAERLVTVPRSAYYQMDNESSKNYYYILEKKNTLLNVKRLGHQPTSSSARWPCFCFLFSSQIQNSLGWAFKSKYLKYEGREKWGKKLKQFPDF